MPAGSRPLIGASRMSKGVPATVSAVEAGESGGRSQLASDLVQQLAALGFRFSVVLADSLDGDSYDFTHAVSHLGVPSVVAIRSNYGVWTAKGARPRQTRWRSFAGSHGE